IQLRSFQALHQTWPAADDASGVCVLLGRCRPQCSCSQHRHADHREDSPGSCPHPGSLEHPLPTRCDDRDLRGQHRELPRVQYPPLGTPTSLIEREQLIEGLAMLKKIRGTGNVDAEHQEILHACEMARQVKQPFRNLMKRSSRPQLVIAIAMQVFQQFTGINAIMFYAPVLFQTIGFKNDASLLSAVITGIVNVLSTVVSVVLVDKVGRRFLLLEACGQMLITQVAIGGLLFVNLRATNELQHGVAIWVVVLVCLFVSSFAWSWGPLGWLIPSETFPLATRTAGYAFAVSSNMVFTFVIAQAFLSMMCHLRAGIFFFFAAWIVVMGLFVIFLLPETKNVPIDEMTEKVWKKHWFWKRFMDEEEEERR
ncbi:Sugar transport protein, partial [Musa troglodytarum]